jgi:O-antigen ligase
VLLVAILSGLVLARSRAGFILAMVAIVGIAAMIGAQRGASDASPAGRRIAAVTIGFAVVFALQFGLQRILTRFGGDQLHDLRAVYTRTTLDAALQNLPFGTGLGTFVPVYATIEKASDVGVRFANRAHNDPAELMLETGIIGALAVALFVGWFLMRTLPLWFKQSVGADPHHMMLQRAASIIVVLVLGHSLLDYPLRTTALAAIFAYCCGVLTPVSSDLKSSGPSSGGREREELVQPGDRSRPISKPVDALQVTKHRRKPAVVAGSDGLGEPPVVEELPTKTDVPPTLSPAPPGGPAKPTSPTSPVGVTHSGKQAGEKWGGSAVQWPDAWQKIKPQPPETPDKS